jgi:hypothetical protein
VEHDYDGNAPRNHDQQRDRKLYAAGRLRSAIACHWEQCFNPTP